MGVNIKFKPAITADDLRAYRFGGTATEGSASMKDVLGGKGANLAEMVRQGLPVPPGFTIPTAASVRYNRIKNDPQKMKEFMETLWGEVTKGLKFLTDEFKYTPLLSVRSGARVSMPGMMDTILNVGLTTESLPYWSDKLGRRTALDSYRRLIQMYASVAMGKDITLFEDALSKLKAELGVTLDHQLDESALARLVSRYKKIAGDDFPDTLDAQLKGAIMAVFRSWMNPRAIEYRHIHSYPEDWGTAVNVQAMVFGNLNAKSGTGVAFTRDPNTGERKLYGDFVVNGQGEDVVAGIRDPDFKVSDLGKWNQKVSDSLRDMCAKLETFFKDMQDVEFTVQDGKLWLLQTRTGMRSAAAAFQIAHDLAVEGVITKQEAVSRVTHEQLLSAMTDQIDPGYKEPEDLKGIGVGGSVVSGKAVFSNTDAINCKEPCILVAKDTNPDDIAGIRASIGILTKTGGYTSHAAVVARGWQKTCVVGCVDLNIDKLLGKSIAKGVYLTLDGVTGRVWINKDVPVVTAASSPAIKELVSWVAGAEVVERVEVTSDLTPDEMIYKGKSLTGAVYIDTALLESTSLKTFNNLRYLGDGMAQSKVTKVFVDLKDMGGYFGPSDQAFNWMFGLKKTHYDHTVENKGGALLEWDAKLLKKVVIRDPLGMKAETIAKLSGLGVKFSGKIGTFGDLLNADGEVEIDDDVMVKVFGGQEAFNKAVKMVEQATGKTLSGKKPKPIYWYDFLTKTKEAA